MPQSSENGRSAVERFEAAYPGGMPEEMRRAAERGDPGPSSADDPAELIRRLDELTRRRPGGGETPAAGTVTGTK